MGLVMELLQDVAGAENVPGWSAMELLQYMLHKAVGCRCSPASVFIQATSLMRVFRQYPRPHTRLRHGR